LSKVRHDKSAGGGDEDLAVFGTLTWMTLV